MGLQFAPLSMFYARALTKSERFTEAEAVLLRQSRVNKGDIDVWYNLAEVAGLAGNIISVHRARAEFFALHGAYQKAIQQRRKSVGWPFILSGFEFTATCPARSPLIVR